MQFYQGHAQGPGPARYPWGSIVELEVSPDATHLICFWSRVTLQPTLKSIGEAVCSKLTWGQVTWREVVEEVCQLAIYKATRPVYWFASWVQSESRATSRTIALFKIIISVTAVTYFRSAPASVGVHVCIRRQTSFDSWSCNTFAAASNHLSYPVF